MKKMLFLFVFSVVLGGAVIAQEEKEDYQEKAANTAEEAHKNALYLGSTDILGFALGYERMFRQNFSLVFEIGVGAGIISAESFYTVLRARWFPVSDSNIGFFVSGALGYGQLKKRNSYFMWEKDDNYDVYGGLISPGIGMKVGFGKPRGFVLTGAIDYDIIFGKKTSYYEYKTEDKGEFGLGFNLNFNILFGYAF